jgi:hypothetical protein
MIVSGTHLSWNSPMSSDFTPPLDPGPTKLAYPLAGGGAQREIANFADAVEANIVAMVLESQGVRAKVIQTAPRGAMSPHGGTLVVREAGAQAADGAGVRAAAGEGDQDRRLPAMRINGSKARPNRRLDSADDPGARLAAVYNELWLGPVFWHRRRRLGAAHATTRLALHRLRASLAERHQCRMMIDE